MVMNLILLYLEVLIEFMICFIIKEKKRISPKIENYLTPLDLAVWIKDESGRVKYGVRLSTYNFELK